MVSLVLSLMLASGANDVANPGLTCSLLDLHTLFVGTQRLVAVIQWSMAYDMTNRELHLFT